MPDIRLATANDSRRCYFPVGRSRITKRTHIKLYVYIVMHINKCIYILYNILYLYFIRTEEEMSKSVRATAFMTNRNGPPFAFQYVSTIRAERLARKFLIRRGKMHLSYFAFLLLAPSLHAPPPHHNLQPHPQTPIDAPRYAKVGRT